MYNGFEKTEKLEIFTYDIGIKNRDWSIKELLIFPHP